MSKNFLGWDLSVALLLRLDPCASPWHVSVGHLVLGMLLVVFGYPIIVLTSSTPWWNKITHVRYFKM
jgi:hypothetical protein